VSLCVLDSSVALAWVLPGEGDAATEALLDRVATAGAVAPGLWPLEIANVLLQAERARRITRAERQQALGLLAALPIRVDPEGASHAWGQSLTLAETLGLTVYDACTLELALRLGQPLASLDRPLRRAALARGVTLLGIEA